MYVIWYILCIFHTYLASFITSSRRLYFLYILISECNNKSLYFKNKSIKLKSALIKVCNCFMFTYSLNLIKCSSFENIFSSVVNRSFILFTKVFISSPFISDISLISDTYKLCIIRCLTLRLFFLFNLIPFK